MIERKENALSTKSLKGNKDIEKHIKCDELYLASSNSNSNSKTTMSASDESKPNLEQHSGNLQLDIEKETSNLGNGRYNESINSTARSFIEPERRCNSVPDITGFWYYTDESGEHQSREVFYTIQEMTPSRGHHRQDRRSSLNFPKSMSPISTLNKIRYYPQKMISGDESSYLNSIEKINAQVMVDILRWKFESGNSRFPDLNEQEHLFPYSNPSYYEDDRDSVLKKIISRALPHLEEDFVIPVRKMSIARTPQTHFSTNDVEIGTVETDHQLGRHAGAPGIEPQEDYAPEEIIPGIAKPQTITSLEKPPAGQPIKKKPHYPLTVIKGNKTTERRDHNRSFYERIVQRIASVVVLSLIVIIVTIIVCG